MIPSFISCDWGTTHFRLRAVTGTSGGESPREVRNDSGAARLANRGEDRAAAFRETLEQGLAELGAPSDWPVLISGMASSTIGWKELPYASLPFNLDGSAAVVERLAEWDRVFLISGIRTDTEMARGEETQAVGLAARLGSTLAERVRFILPGTHSKHLTVEHGRLVGLQTFLTGELFDLLLRQSVLRHTTDPLAELDATAFVEGVSTARSQPLLGALFQTRTRQVLGKHPSPSNTSFLSGLLIGAELDFVRQVEDSLPVVVAAGGGLRESYRLAAEALGMGARVQTVESESLTVRGHQVLATRCLSASIESRTSARA